MKSVGVTAERQLGDRGVSQDESGKRAGPEWRQANERTSMPCKSNMRL